MRSSIEEALAYQIRVMKLPEPVREHRFHPVRKWRFDFAFLEHKVAAECEGAIYVNGRHTRGAGFELDCEKYNAATSLGWRVFKFTPSMVKKGVAVALLADVLKEAA